MTSRHMILMIKNNNGFSGYELDPGTYTIKLGKNSHEAWDSFTMNVAAPGIKIPK